MPALPVEEDWESGTGLKGYVWRAPESHATILLQHGYAEHTRRYVAGSSGLISRLVASGFDVHAFDMCGHGGSPGRRGGVDVAEAVQAHIDARKALPSDERPLFLFGHSLGGLVTAASVARNPQGVSGVVLSSPALLLEASALKRLAARALSRIAPGLGVVKPASPEGLSRLTEEVAAFAADPTIYRGKIQAVTGATILSVAHETWAHYPGWNLPTLVFHGTEDRFIDVKGSERFTATIRSTDKTLLLVQDGRHELLNDLGREAMLETVLEWLHWRLR